MSEPTALDTSFMQITPAAEGHFARLLQEEDTQGMNLRMFVANRGTVHADISITFSPEGEEQKDDLKIAFDAFALFVAADSKAALNEAVVDFKDDGLEGGQLSIKAPHLKGNVPNADEPLEDQIQHVLDSEINPNLASHGGKVALDSILDDSLVLLRFSGGCHGCSMSTVTLKNGIEKVLKEKFPQIVEIRDVTDHTSGEDPYC